MTNLRRIFAIALVSAAIAFSGTGPAAAHATLVDTSPEDGAQLDDEPAEVSFTFNQEIGTPAYIVVEAPDGSRVDSGDPDVDDDVVTQDVDTAGESGEYEASYRVVSADGHPVSGNITYDVTAGASPSTASDGDNNAAKTEDGGESFWSRHGIEILVGLAVLAVAAAVFAWPGRRRNG